MNPVYNITLEDGTLVGCGTTFEFNHWNEMDVYGAGAKLGDLIGHEPAARDEKRKIAWAA